MFVVRWEQSEVFGYRDLLPSEWFYPGAEEATLQHIILPKGEGRPISARCSLVISGRTALLDYAGDHSDYNLGNLVSIGQAQIEFADDTLGAMIEYRWKGVADRSFALAKVSFESIDRITDEEIQEAEGDLLLAKHMKRERSRYLVMKKLSDARSRGKIACEACLFSFEDKYQGIGTDFCEVHHRLPLSLGSRINSLDDLAILCPNCHRMIHRAMPISVEDFRRLHVKSQLS